jgi:hypothetical protein
MRNSVSLLTSAALAVVVALGTPTASFAQRIAALSPLDSAAAQLVELELQRVSLKGNAVAVSEALQRADSRIAAVHERLRALPDGAAADSAATGRVLLALDLRAEHLRNEYQRARLAYVDAFPPVRQLLDEERAIVDRATAIRRGF